MTRRSDQYRISPYNITPEKKVENTRLKEIISKLRSFLLSKIFNYVLSTLRKQKTAWRVFILMFDVRGLTMIFWHFFSVDFSRVLKGVTSRFWLKRTSTTPWRKSLMKDWKTSKKKENQSQRVKKGGKNLSNYRERKWSIQDHL